VATVIPPVPVLAVIECLEDWSLGQE